MKSPPQILLGVGFLLLLFGGACKKEPDPANASVGTSLLIGKWKVKAVGTDFNGNDSLEVAEYDSKDPGLVAFLTYRANKTGFAEEIYLGQTLISGNFTWQLVNNDQSLIRILEGDTLTYSLKTLTSNEVRGSIQFGSTRDYFIWEK